MKSCRFFDSPCWRPRAGLRGVPARAVTRSVSTTASTSSTAVATAAVATATVTTTSTIAAASISSPAVATTPTIAISFAFAFAFVFAAAAAAVSAAFDTATFAHAVTAAVCDCFHQCSTSHQRRCASIQLIVVPRTGHLFRRGLRRASVVPSIGLRRPSPSRVACQVRNYQCPEALCNCNSESHQ